jgi:hypothetical protein
MEALREARSMVERWVFEQRVGITNSPRAQPTTDNKRAAQNAPLPLMHATLPEKLQRFIATPACPLHQLSLLGN